MRSYVWNILNVYFNEQWALLNRNNQVCLWTIDCWSVHRSQEFRDWMRENYPWILMQYVPGGCTGIIQLCDVGIQWIFKHTMKKTTVSHIVKEIVVHLNNNKDPGMIMLTKTVGVLRNWSVEWLVKGYQVINKPEVVKKVCTLNEGGAGWTTDNHGLGLGVV